MNEFDLEALARLMIQKHNEQLDTDDQHSRLDFDAMTASERDRWMAGVGAVAQSVASQIRKA